MSPSPSGSKLLHQISEGGWRAGLTRVSCPSARSPKKHRHRRPLRAWCGACCVGGAWRAMHSLPSSFRQCGSREPVAAELGAAGPAATEPAARPDTRPVARAARSRAPVDTRPAARPVSPARRVRAARVARRARTGAAGTTGGAGTSGAAGLDRRARARAGPFRSTPLDMNDVTILAPLPQSSRDAGASARNRSRGRRDGDRPARALRSLLRERRATGRPLPLRTPPMSAFTSSRCASIFAIAICRARCPDAEDARMRLVFQP